MATEQISIRPPPCFLQLNDQSDGKLKGRVQRSENIDTCVGSRSPQLETTAKVLLRLDISQKVDSSSGSIARRYARTDQIAIPYGITIDFDSIKEPHTATLRERETMKQIRAPISELPEIVRDLSQDRRTWVDVQNNHPAFDQQEASK